MIDATNMARKKGFEAEGPKPTVSSNTVCLEATMHADLDTLCTVVYCTADDLLPEKTEERPAPRPPMPRSSPWPWPKSSWASPLTAASCAPPAGRSATSFPYLPAQHAYHKRRARLSGAIEWLFGVFCSKSPGADDDLLLLDSTPVECGRSVETARRSALADICGYGYSRSHSRWFWGCRLHLACAPDGTPRAVELAPADRPEREVALPLLPRALRGGETIVCDKGYAGRDFARKVKELGATIVRPAAGRRRGQKGRISLPSASASNRSSGPAKTCSTWSVTALALPHNLVVRIVARLLALAACICLNHQLGRPSRAIVDYTA